MGGESIQTSANIYSNEDYGFSINLPDGWKEAREISKRETNRLRHEVKSALAVFFAESETIDPAALGLLITFQAKDQPTTASSEELGKRLKEIVKNMVEPPRDQILESKVLTIDNQPAVQAKVCASFENSPKCNLIESLTVIFLDRRNIRIQFSVSKTLYPKYEEKIKQSLSSIRLSQKKSFEMPVDCQKTDIEIIDHDWKSDRVPIDKTGKHRDLDMAFILWEVKLRNKSDKTCLVRVGYMLFDKNGKRLFNDTRDENIDPNGEKVVKGGFGGMVPSSLLPKINSNQAELISVK